MKQREHRASPRLSLVQLLVDGAGAKSDKSRSTDAPYQVDVLHLHQAVTSEPQVEALGHQKSLVAVGQTKK